MTFYPSNSKRARYIRSRAAPILCGILVSFSVANVAVAEDAKVVASQILDEAIPEFQRTMASMSQGCHNGQGVPR